MDKATLPYRPCVGVMVLNANREVWMGRRTDRPNKEVAGGWWQMPQGGIDPDEDPRAAALRELGEETGVRSVEVLAESATWHTYDLPPELLGRVWGGKYRGQTQKWFALRFTGPDSEVDLHVPGHDQEFDAWRWAPLDDILPLIVPFKRHVYAAVFEEFAPLVRR